MSDKRADLAGPGISTYQEVAKILPKGYTSLLTPRETMRALFGVKSYIEENLCRELNLMMVQVPLIACLSNASLVEDAAPRPHARRLWRASLDAGARRHDAAVETADGSDPTGRDYRLNVAAYELDKALGLGLVVPSVLRQVNGRPASLTWWVDDLAMSELDRRRKGIDPPDPERWMGQVQAVRVFDELISNLYRDQTPALYLNSVWDNLLITHDWTIWIIDHTGAFRARDRLESPESLTRCDRALLRRLRRLDREQLQLTLGRYLSSRQLDALEARRQLLVKHFDEQVAARGEAAVL